MSFLICSVMGIGLTASGEMNLVKMVTASFSIPEKKKNAGHRFCTIDSFCRERKANQWQEKKNSDQVQQELELHIQRANLAGALEQKRRD